MATAGAFPGVVVFDLRLPGELNGPQLARRLHPEANRGISTIIVSSDTDEKYAREATAAGAGCGTSRTARTISAGRRPRHSAEPHKSVTRSRRVRGRLHKVRGSTLPVSQILVPFR